MQPTNTIDNPLLVACRLAREGVARLMRGVTAVAIVVGFASSAGLAQDAPPTESDAAAQYVANLKRLLEEHIVPGLRRAIPEVSSSRPPALRIDVIADASPYSIDSQVAPDGSLTVRLSIGYVTLHDAALDAVALSAALNRPQDLDRYLQYQLRLAQENHRRRMQRASALHAMTFPEFIRLDARVAQQIYAQRAWRRSRDHVQVDSLGWTVAHLLVRADPKLAGTALLPVGAGEARLAAAAGWFPVPPFATALGMATIERSPAGPLDERAALCHAADLMDAGLSTQYTHPSGQTEERDANERSRVANIRAQIARMRRDGRCASGAITAFVAPTAGHANSIAVQP